jgi:hypothetical protein
MQLQQQHMQPRLMPRRRMQHQLPTGGPLGPSLVGMEGRPLGPSLMGMEAGTHTEGAANRTEMTIVFLNKSSVSTPVFFG